MRTKTKIVIPILLCVVFVIISCGERNSKKDSSTIKKDSLLPARINFPDGKYWIGHITNDSLRQGIGKFYDKSGTLLEEFNYKNGYRWGKGTSYYPSGKIQHVGYFKNDTIDSLQFWYFKNGHIEEESYIANGHLRGEQLIYNENGSLKEYLFHTEDGKISYKRVYNKNGDATVVHGTPFLDFLIDPPKKINDSMKTGTICAHPPDCKVSLFINEDNNLFKPIYIDSISSDLTEIDRKIANAGIYKIKVIVKLKDNKTSQTQQFTKTGIFQIH